MRRHRPKTCASAYPVSRGGRRFTLPPQWDSGGSTLVRFDGVDSCFAVFVNGAAVGHSMGSRLVREFDITKLVRPENNVIAVRVHQWSAGSYLEDQDMWWLSGIFRGVTSTPPITASAAPRAARRCRLATVSRLTRVSYALGFST